MKVRGLASKENDLPLANGEASLVSPSHMSHALCAPRLYAIVSALGPGCLCFPVAKTRAATKAIACFLELPPTTTIITTGMMSLPSP